jgi:hypothetical protein
MLRLVTLVRTDISEELSASFIRVTIIGELGVRRPPEGDLSQVPLQYVSSALLPVAFCLVSCFVSEIKLSPFPLSNYTNYYFCLK